MTNRTAAGCANTSKCALGTPYPEVANVCENEEAVRLLQMDYAAAKSELGASHSYMYQHSVLLPCYPEIAETLECIGIVEMTHATMLANAIVALGGDPQYLSLNETTMENEYWNASTADYRRFVRDILTRDIADEKSAIAQYRDHACVIPIPKVSALLNRISEDEELHVRILTGLLESV